MTHEYPDLQSHSATLFEQGRRVIAGGNTRASLCYPPYPLFAAKGEGAWLTDVDGTRRLDCVNSNTVGILGHSHPALLSALDRQMNQLISVGMPTPLEVELASVISNRVPSMEQVRFANSGTEALMFAVRAARAFTGRSKVAKIEGAYNSSYDSLFYSIRPTPDRWGPAEAPTPVPHSAGLSSRAVEDMLVFPANDLASAAAQIRANRDTLACVVVDPLIAYLSFLPLTREYLTGLRELTREFGIVLIFDEVLSFRIAYHGAQGSLGVTPDLTTLGKIVGGGLPIGIFGGRRDIMHLFDHAQGKPVVEQSGTFGGNPLTMAAGIAAMGQLTPDAYAHLDRLAERLRAGLLSILRALSIPARVTGKGSLVGIVFTEREYSNYREYFAEMTRTSGLDSCATLHRGLLNEGVFCGRLAGFNLSLPMQAEDIDFLLAACQRVLERVSIATHGA